ncbi:unnamed protein product [Larinioides sclopetarius]|uniref:Acyltransferase 3 domain-containing protein n=1 Tax=Larinioides sclopetarius TaxID=280406 RepID=A0AAV2AKL7_9ARAC
MDACPQNSFVNYPWQATLMTILRELRDEFKNVNTTSALCHQPVRKKLTTEALFMIYLILLFVILTLIRSTLSVYEYCKNVSTCKNKDNTKRGASGTEEEKKLVKTSSHTVFLTNLKRFLDCFCIKSNARGIFSTVSTEEQISSLHGIRAIIVVWDLVGHTSMFYTAAVRTRAEFQSTMEFGGTQIHKNAIFVVDAFLVLSGFLNGYLFSQRYEKKKGKISWFSFYVHRLVRIIPMYFIVLGFYSTLFSYLGSGPVWPTYDTNPVCRENWMWHVLFINNFNSNMKQCLTTTWYLACEIQLYIISPVFLVLLIRRPKIGYFITALGISVSSFMNFIITKQYKLIDGLTRLAEYYSTDAKEFHRQFWKYFDILYVKPYSRLGTFLIGMALGCYLFQKKDTTIKRNSMVQLSLGWIMAVMFLWTSLFALYGREESVLETAVYNGLKHLLFSCVVAWIIFVCVTGQGDASSVSTVVNDTRSFFWSLTGFRGPYIKDYCFNLQRN